MRVLFRLRPKSTVIYCRVKVNGAHANDFSTFIKVPSRDDWDSAKQRIRGRSQQVNDDNLKLDFIRSQINQLHLAHPDFSAQHLADLYTGKQKVSYTFWELIQLFEDRCVETYRNKETLGTYTRRIGNIRRFLEEKKKRSIMPDRVNLGLADDFVAWMKSQSYDHQYIVRHVQVLCNITEMATRKEILKVDPLASFVLKRKEKTNTDHLTRQELQMLEQTEWIASLQHVVDLFLFSVYTGLHFEDAQTVTPDEIGEGIDGRLWLFKPRGKYADSQFFNSAEMVQLVPLHSRAQQLIKKYGGVENLPKISNVNYNKALKQVQFIAGIRLKLTVKIARKTFTDIMLNELRISEETVARMLGHKTTRYVRHYGKADERRIAGELINTDW